jgi:hypothetical protein
MTEAVTLPTGQTPLLSLCSHRLRLLLALAPCLASIPATYPLRDERHIANGISRSPRALSSQTTFLHLGQEACQLQERLLFYRRRSTRPIQARRYPESLEEADIEAEQPVPPVGTHCAAGIPKSTLSVYKSYRCDFQFISRREPYINTFLG